MVVIYPNKLQANVYISNNSTNITPTISSSSTSYLSINFETPETIEIPADINRDKALFIHYYLKSIVIDECEDSIDSFTITNLGIQNAIIEAKNNKSKDDWWKNLYPGFDYTIDLISENIEVGAQIYYDTNAKILIISGYSNLVENCSEILCIFYDKTFVIHFVRNVKPADTNPNDFGKSYLDEFYGPAQYRSTQDSWRGEIEVDLKIEPGIGFDKVYVKPI